MMKDLTGKIATFLGTGIDYDTGVVVGIHRPVGFGKGKGHLIYWIRKNRTDYYRCRWSNPRDELRKKHGITLSR